MLVVVLVVLVVVKLVEVVEVVVLVVVVVVLVVVLGVEKVIVVVVPAKLVLDLVVAVVVLVLVSVVVLVVVVKVCVLVVVRYFGSIVSVIKERVVDLIINNSSPVSLHKTLPFFGRSLLPLHFADCKPTLFPFEHENRHLTAPLTFFSQCIIL